jgi:transposase
MARYKPYDYSQMNMIPVSLENQLVPGTLEYAIHYIIEERLDLTMFNDRYKNDLTGRKAIDPKVLLKIVLLGYSRGLTSSRLLEKACRENIIFMAMSCGDKPDHSTIAPFVSGMENEITPLYTQILMICDEEGLLGGTHFSIDGVKLPSNSAKDTSGKFEELKSKKENLEKKVKEVIREHKEKDKETGKAKEKQKDDTHEKRLRKLKQQAERIEQFLKENEPRKGTSGKEVQSNITDNDSAKMVSSHGVIQGYNANALVDEKHQIIVHAEVFGENEDSAHTETMLEGAKNNLEEIGWEEPLKDKIISADSGFHSINSLKACEEYEVDAYIPDKDFRKRDLNFRDRDKYRRPTDRKKTNHKRKKGLFTNEDFKYDEKIGRIVCPGGASLYIRNRNFETLQGYKGINYRAPKTACRNCDLRSKCLRNPETESRQVYVFYENSSGNLLDDMKQKIDSPEGRKTYSKRLGIVEPVFANIRARKRMDHFTLRGQVKVNIQWMLYSLVHNIEKIANFGSGYAGMICAE